MTVRRRATAALAAAITLASASAQAAQVTETLHDGNNAAFTILGHADNAGDFYPGMSLCDPTAAATPLCAAVTANGLSVTLTTPLVAGSAQIGTVGVTALPSLPAGANAIGSVTISNTPTVNLGAMLPLVAGSAAIGTVGVTALPSLPAGANAIGSVGVTSLPALVAGSALIGSVSPYVNGSVVSTANPDPVVIEIGGAVISGANPVPVSGTVGGAVISSSNPQPVYQLLGGTALGSGNPMPVAGNVGGYTGAPSALTPTVSTTAYTTGMSVGGLLTFTGLVRSGQTTAQIEKALVLFNDTQITNLDLILFNASPTSSTVTDHVALSIAAADLGKIAGTIHISDCTNLGTPEMCQGFQPIKIGGTTSQTVYGVLVLRNTISLTLASTTDVTITAAGSED